MIISRIAIFASGNGTNAEAIIQYFRNHKSIEIVLLLSNDPSAFALERAKKLNIPAKIFNKEQFRESDQVLDWLREFAVSHVVLAGFLWLMPSRILAAFPDRVINIHPALLPKFGGKGMYGMKVHEQVRAANCTETGITIHLVNERYDEGKILFQAKCPVSHSDTPAMISSNVNRLELEHYPRIIEQWINGT